MAENYQNGNGYEDSESLEEPLGGAERNGYLNPPVFIVNLDVKSKTNISVSPGKRVGNHLSFKLPRDSIDCAFIEPLPIQARGRLLIKKTMEKLSRMINFRLEDDIKNLILRMDEDAQGQIFYHLSERLEEWTIKKVYRDKHNKIDSFYHNKASNTWFRSFVEVQNFIIYQQFPKPHSNKWCGELSSKLSASKRESNVKVNELKFKIVRDKGGHYRVVKSTNSDAVKMKSNDLKLRFKIVGITEGNRRIVRCRDNADETIPSN